MAAPINTPLTGEIGSLTIDDLFAPVPEVARLGGPGPFVINLTASSAPIAVPVKSFPGCPSAYVYQVQRMEDRRLRYRLRLGPFVKEDEVDVILKKVRDIYPGALTATADTDDLRAIATMRAKTAMPPPVLSVASTLVAASRVVSPALGSPAIVSPPVVAAKPASLAAPPPVSPPVLVREQKLQPSGGPVACKSVPLARVEHADRIPTLESTQTVRALTSLELEDAQAARWFVIELSLAEHAFDPDTVPNLDIFRVYRLYSVAGLEQGRIVHALRLGFFSEEIAARAVASYLGAFYDKPTIKRVSTAERQRFAEQSLEPRKDVGATGKQAIIEITSERFVRALRSG